MRERFGHCALGDLLEGDALGDLFGNLRRLHQVPGDRLAFAVRVGGQVHFLGLRRRLRQILDHIFLVVGYAILGREVVIDVHAQLRFEQIAHVAN